MSIDSEKWSDRLRRAQLEWEANSSDIQACDAMWKILDGGIGNNLKGIERAIQTYRSAALQSEEGVERLADALFEVFEMSGRLPVKEDLGAELRERVFDLTIEPNRGRLGWLRKTLVIETG